MRNLEVLRLFVVFVLIMVTAASVSHIAGQVGLRDAFLSALSSTLIATFTYQVIVEGALTKNSRDDEK